MPKNRIGEPARATPKIVNNSHDSRLAYSMRETAELLGISEKSVYNLIQAGKLRAVKPANRVLVPKTSIEKMLLGDES